MTGAAFQCASLPESFLLSLLKPRTARLLHTLSIRPTFPTRTATFSTHGSSLKAFAKAQELTKVRLRREREPLLAAQDVAFQRAQETNADTSAIVAEKQRLRDITKLADSATTLAELRAIKVEA